MRQGVARDTAWLRQPAPLHREMGFVGGALFLSGAALVVVHLLVTSTPYASRGTVVAMTVAATAAGGFYVWAGARLRLPMWVFALGTSAGAVMVTILVLAGGPERTATFGVLYVFVSTYGFYYYGPGIAWWLVALDGLGFGIALGVHDVEGAVAEWAVVVGTSVAAGFLTGLLHQRTQQLLETEQETVRTLSELDGWKTTFLRAVAHDLRSPLAIMHGMLLSLQQHDDELDAEQRRQLLDRSVASAERLEQLLGDLLDIERLQAGVLEPELAPAALDEVVRTSIDDLDLRGRTVVTDLAPVTAVVEAAKVDRIVTNLVRNAVTHTGRDTTVWVRLEATPTEAVLIVEDDDPGLDRALREGIFDAFRREGDGPGEGVGLGLHLVRRFTDLHHGTVEAGDRPGGGARFEVRLPLDQVPPAGGP